MKEEIKKIIKEFHRRDNPEIVDRDIKIPLNSKKIISIIGPRRSGKTFLLYQLMSEIKDKNNIIYINFEDERLDFNKTNLDLIFKAYFELYPEKKEKDLILFFDEIQEIEGWEKFIRRIYDSFTKKIFITGSSAKLLSKEIATSLRGRTISYELFPLSFKEYLKFKKIEIETNTTRGEAKLIKEFKNFLKRGGFPETVFMEDEIRRKTLRSYLDVMTYRDIIKRYEIKNINALNHFIKKIISNPAGEISLNKIYNEMKSLGMKISKDSIYEYNKYLEDAFMVFFIKNYSESLVKQNIKKFYPIDSGLAMNNIVTLSEEFGKLLELICFIELKRREKEVYYFLDGKECDFVVKEKNKIVEAIQVTKSLKNDKTRQREINGILSAMKRFNLKKGLILTYDEFEEFEVDKKKIYIRPIWKWLLE